MGGGEVPGADDVAAELLSLLIAGAVTGAAAFFSSNRAPPLKRIEVWQTLGAVGSTGLLRSLRAIASAKGISDTSTLVRSPGSERRRADDALFGREIREIDESQLLRREVKSDVDAVEGATGVCAAGQLFSGDAPENLNELYRRPAARVWPLARASASANGTASSPCAP